MNRALMLLAPLLLAGSALAASEPPAAAVAAAPATFKFRGYAYDLSSNAFLYTEVHEQKIVEGRWMGGTIDYYGPEGRQIGHKVLDFTFDPHVPVYQLDLTAAGGYMEAVTAVTPDRIEMARRDHGSQKVERATLKRKGLMTADSGFHSFIRDHFAELQAGQTVEFSFAVAGNLDFFKFRAKKTGDTVFDGKPAVALRVEPDSLLRFLVDPLSLIYEPKERRLLEYRGVSNLHDEKTGKPYNVRIVYPAAKPADAPVLDLP